LIFAKKSISNNPVTHFGNDPVIFIPIYISYFPFLHGAQRGQQLDLSYLQLKKDCSRERQRLQEGSNKGLHMVVDGRVDNSLFIGPGFKSCQIGGR
jgi:hypothetical protein